MNTTLLKNLPSVDQLLRRDALQPLIASVGRDTVRDRLREILDEFRLELVGSNGNAESFPDAATLEEKIEARLAARFDSRRKAQTQRVINATGVVLHTNLGRAPLGDTALAAIQEVARDYSNLEYDLASGKRGKRGLGLEASLRELLHCEAAAVVNNCAAAVLLTLNTLAEGGEVIVSRGELIEIGGSFRIPDVIAKSGARIREVGTTNRTRLADYEKAINENTKVILRAHPSNYRIIGFTEKPALEDLAKLARERGLPLFEDLGSGCLIDLNPLGIHDEPAVAQAIKAGASVVAFSGDKLLGGPQAGIILGKAELIKRIKSNPLMRALRVDKLTYAALEATVAAYLSGRALEEIPVQAMLHQSKETISRRAQSFLQQAQKMESNLKLKLMDGHSVIGGGSAPETQLPTTLISLTHTEMTAGQMEEKLRLNAPPVITRIVENQLVLDLRTVSPQSENEILSALVRL